MDFARTWLIASVVCFLVLAAPITASGADAGPMDLELAKRYFDEAKACAERDGGTLWGADLYGPMIFIDPQTRAIVANQADKEGLLQKEGDVFVGHWPADAVFGNTAMPWAGQTWTMVIWPLPEDRGDRLRLMMHELWHRVQKDLGFTNGDSGNAHLDTQDGRVWMQLEWRALKAALEAVGVQRQRHVYVALLFRAYRRSLYTSAAAEERNLEMNEGLAEYTGIRASAESESDAIMCAMGNLDRAPQNPTFVRSFAYASGPAYGILLDAVRPDWRKGLSVRDDLGELLRNALSISLPKDLAAEAKKRAKDYGGDRLVVEETRREERRQKRIAEYRRRLVDGPVLILPLQIKQISFDPRNLQPMGELGTVYPTLSVKDEWGSLSVTGGALLSDSWSTVQVPAPKDPNACPLKGDGWELDLAEGWVLRPGERKGDFIVTRLEGG
jgi:hypothetical protein